uniref:Uncharacterized protein n=1 Tax=Rhizophora mucronata TaxID=61149 RepID=A0A2P2NJX2_RHIMU
MNLYLSTCIVNDISQVLLSKQPK